VLELNVALLFRRVFRTALIAVGGRLLFDAILWLYGDDTSQRLAECVMSEV